MLVVVASSPPVVNPQTFDPPIPPLRSVSHGRLPGVEHVYNQKDFRTSLTRNPLVIIGHGIKVENKNFRRQLYHVELVPVFVASSRRPTKLTKHRLE
jgi:hypothetical protein